MRPLVFLFLGLLATTLRAITVTNSYSGASASVTVTWNESTGKFDWSRSLSAVSNGWGPAVWVYRISAEGGSVTSTVFDVNTPGSSASGSFTAAPGSWIRVGARVSNASLQTPPNAWWNLNPDQQQDVQAATPPPASYGVTVTLPKNETPSGKLYFALQNGQQVGARNVSPGEGPVSWYIGNLPTDDPVQVVEVTGGTVDFFDGEFRAGAGTEYVPSAPQVTPTGETSPGAGATAGQTVAATNTQPVPTTTPTGTPTAPTVTPVPAAPTPTTPPIVPAVTTPLTAPTPSTKPTPEGDGPAKEADIERVGNQITEAVEAASMKATEAANKQVEAVDKVAGAVADGLGKTVAATDEVAGAVWEAGKATTAAGDKVATSVWESGKANVEGLNKVSVGLDAIRSKVEEGNKTLVNISTATGATASKLDATNSKLDSLVAKVEGEDATAAEFPVTEQTLSADAAQVTELTNKLPAVPVVFPTSVGTDSHFRFTLKFPPITEPFEVDVDMSPYAASIGFIRGLMKSCLAVLFFFLVVNTLRRAVA